MNIKINGKEEARSEITLLDLLKAKNIEPQMVSVELNSTMIPRKNYAETTLKDGDQIEFLYFMGGGGGTAASERSRPRWAA